MNTDTLLSTVVGDVTITMSTTTQPAATDDNKISKTFTVGGRTFQVEGDVNLKFTEIVGPVVTDPEPGTGGDPTKPTEGTVKKGGWGANMDPKVWVRTVMKDFPDQFKVTDGSKNVATNFKTTETADNFIKYFQRHPDEVSKFFDVTDPEPGTGGGGGSTQQPLPDGVGLPYQVTGRQMDSTFRGPTKRNYASGKPSDWTIEKNVKQIQYENILAVADISVHPPAGWEHDDDLCIKIGGTHMGSGWFCNGLGIYEGDSGLGKEEEHPKTDKKVVKGKNYGDQRGKRVQVAATYFKSNNRTEYWVFDQAAKKWDMACGAENVGGFHPKNSGETESQLRIDGFAGEKDPPTIHSFTVYEIKMQQ